MGTAPVRAVLALRQTLVGHRDGIFAGTNNLVEVITGRPALTVEEIADANRGAFATAGQASSWEKVSA